MSINIISSVDSPLQFFNNFFLHGGFHQYYKDFGPQMYGNLGANDIDFDKDNMIIHIRSWDQMEADMVSWSIDFKKELATILYNQYKTSCTFIDQKVFDLNKRNYIKTYIEKIVYTLKHLYCTIEDSPELNKYGSINLFFIREMLKTVFSKYETFSPKLDVKTIEIIEKSIVPQIQQKTIQPVKKEKFTAFKWKSNNPLRNSFLLHEGLVDYKIIDNEPDVTIFHNYFSGELFERMEKIKWIDKARNGHYNKKSLIYLLDKLASNDLIAEEDTQKLYDIISIVFVRGDDEPFENLEVSDSSKNAINKTKTQKKYRLNYQTTIK